MLLRDYQRRAVDAVKAALPRRPVLVAPTGSGKTVMGSAVVVEVDVPTVWLAHRRELVTQAAETLRGYGLTVDILMPGCPAPVQQSPTRVVVASKDTLILRREKPAARLIVIDEAHHVAAGTYRKLLASYPDALVLGLTATPFRLDGRGLGDTFGELIVAAYTDELVADGTLHAPRVFAARHPDLRGVRMIAGDYSLGQLSQRANTTELTGDIVKTWTLRAGGMKTVCFAIDVNHSKGIVNAFRAAGIPAEHIDGTSTDRDAILARLRSGETYVVSNCQVLTEGWDLPALEAAIIARPTASLCLHLQMIGRIMRACEGKTGCLVLDHAGNHHVHGLVTRRLTYSLAGKTTGTSEPLGLKSCPECYLLVPVSARQCGECGYVFTGDAREVFVRGDELMEFADDFEFQAEVWRALQEHREAMGLPQRWAEARFKERFGRWPMVYDGRLMDPDDRETRRLAYEALAREADQKGYRPGWASHRYRAIFGVWPTGFVSKVRGKIMAERFGA